MFATKLTTEALMNGGCNSDSPKVNKNVTNIASFSKTKLNAGKFSKSLLENQSKWVVRRTISRKV